MADMAQEYAETIREELQAWERLHQIWQAIGQDPRVAAVMTPTRSRSPWSVSARRAALIAKSWQASPTPVASRSSRHGAPTPGARGYGPR